TSWRILAVIAISREMMEAISLASLLSDSMALVSSTYSVGSVGSVSQRATTVRMRLLLSTHWLPEARVTAALSASASVGLERNWCTTRMARVVISSSAWPDRTIRTVSG